MTPPRLPCRVAQKKILDVMSVMAIAWTPDKAYVSLLDHGEAQGCVDVRCAVAALAASFLLQMHVHSTQMTCCEHN